jgi:hypothetical protein
MNQRDRERNAALRPVILAALTALERKYGEAAVSGTYNRHRKIRAAVRKVARQKVELNAAIRRLRA